MSGEKIGEKRLAEIEARASEATIGACAETITNAARMRVLAEDVANLAAEFRASKAVHAQLRADLDEAHSARVAWEDDARRENDLRIFAERERAAWFSGKRALAEAAQLRAQKDGAYLERNLMVALTARMALALGLRAGIRRHEPDPDPTWEDDWKNVVEIELPTGRVSWHYHDSERNLFADLPPFDGQWDGAPTDAKYDRVRDASVAVLRATTPTAL